MEAWAPGTFMKAYNRLVLLFAVVLVAGCDRKTSSPNSEEAMDHLGKAHPNPISLVKSGLSFSEMTNLFGPPISSREHFGQMSHRFTFVDFTNNETRVVGVTVWVENEKVERFGTIVADLPLHRPLIEARYFASVRLEASQAVLDFQPKAITPSELYGSDQPFVRKAVIDLDPADVEKVRQFSSTHFGSRIKVYLNGEYVEDLLVAEPIDEDQFEIVFRQSELPLVKLYNQNPPTGGEAQTKPQ